MAPFSNNSQASDRQRMVKRLSEAHIDFHKASERQRMVKRLSEAQIHCDHKAPDRVVMVQKLSDGSLSSNSISNKSKVSLDAGKQIFINIEDGVAHQAESLHEKFRLENNLISSNANMTHRRSKCATFCFVITIMVIIGLACLATVALVRLLSREADLESTQDTLPVVNISSLNATIIYLGDNDQSMQRSQNISHI